MQRNSQPGWAALILIVIAMTALVSCQPVAAPPTKAPAPTAIPINTPVGTIEAVPATLLPEVASGLRVMATIRPTCPGPERPSQVCTKPYAGEFVVTSKDDKAIARFTTDQDGRAVIDLPPGDYHIAPKLGSDSPYPRGGSIDVSVTKGAYTDVNLELDTGIR
jgi:hypothetical protein